MKTHTRTSTTEETVAIECGSLPIFLQHVLLQDVFLMPLERTVIHGPQVLKQYLLHLTARPHRHSPILYTSFLVAEVEGLGRAATVIFPYRGATSMPMGEALARASFLQQQAQQVLTEFLEAHVSRVQCPARYRLPEEWVWSARCIAPQLLYRDDRWQLA